MSEHTWVQENTATYVVDGLDTVERERFELHIAECEECSKFVIESRDLDKQLSSMFADVRPSPGLEDRVIQSLRSSPPRRSWHRSIYAQVSLAAAALLLFGSMGVFFSDAIENGSLQFPGAPFLQTSRPDKLASASPLFQQESGSPTRAASATPVYSDYLGGALGTDEMLESGQSVEDYWESRGEGSKNTLMMGEIAGGEQSGFDVDLSFESRFRTSSQNGAADWKDGGGQMGGGGLGGGGLGGGGRGGGGGGGRQGGEGRANDRFDGAWGYTYGRSSVDTTTASTWDSEVVDNYIKLDAIVSAVAPPVSSVSEIAAVGEKPAYILHSAATPSVDSPIISLSGPPQSAQKNSELQTPATDPGNRVQGATPGRAKVIRSGQIEFEIESFDPTLERIMAIVAEEDGFIATVNSEKLPNGKVRGQIVVRVPPERLDMLVLKLRALGELKSQELSSQDVSKKYTDLESRLRAARAMEERLLEMIRTGKGEIKDLLEAEKELGVWRTKIEEFEGELRYYNNLIALSTLTITLNEKDVRAPASVSESEKIQIGIEVEDVDVAHQTLLELITEFDGRVTKSELKKHTAEQFSAIVHFDVVHESTGPLRDRLRQLGHVARLDINRVQDAQKDPSVPRDTKVDLKDAQFFVSLYNLTNIAPRETVHIQLACVDTESAFRDILKHIEQATGRVITSNLNRQPDEQTTGAIQFDMLVAGADAVLEAVKATGEVMQLQVTENADAQNVTRSKRGFNIKLWAMGTVAPRQTTVVQLASRDVAASFIALQEAVRNGHGRVLSAQLNEQDKENITAQFDFEIQRDQEDTVAAGISAAGDILTRTVSQRQDTEKAIDSKVRFQVSLINQAKIPPRETLTLGIEVDDVDRAVEAIAGQVIEAKGRIIGSHVAHERSGRITATVTVQVPLSASIAMLQKFKTAGTVRALQSARNPRVPESQLAVAQFDVTLSNAELIVPSDEGVGSQIRKGLSTSFIALSWSLIVVLVGVSFALPWLLVLYAGYRISRRFRPKTA